MPSSVQKAVEVHPSRVPAPDCDSNIHVEALAKPGPIGCIPHGRPSIHTVNVRDNGSVGSRARVFVIEANATEVYSMLNSEVAQHQIHFPDGFRRDFDAHIYYDAETREWAQRMRQEARQFFQTKPIFTGDMVDQLVGPHSLPMFEINFPRDLLSEVQSWLQEKRGALSVLIHEVTGDDPRDHSVGATWLGMPLPLDVTKLDPSPAPKV